MQGFHPIDEGLQSPPCHSTDFRPGPRVDLTQTFDEKATSDLHRRNVSASIRCACMTPEIVSISFASLDPDSSKSDRPITSGNANVAIASVASPW